MPQETSTFAIDESLDSADVFDESSNSINNAYQQATLLTHSLRETQGEIPRLIDTHARVIGLNPEPYDLTGTRAFFGQILNGELASLIFTQGRSVTCQEVVDELNGDSDFFEQAQASKVTIEGIGYLLIESKVSGSNSSIAPATADDTRLTLGLPSFDTVTPESEIFTDLLNETTDVTGVDDNPLDVANHLVGQLRVLSSMISGYKFINQLDLLEAKVGVDLTYLRKPDEALNSRFD